MKLAFCLNKYFPFGGLQRDFLQIAQLCRQQGHQVDIYTMAWSGIRPANLNVVLLPNKKFRNHAQVAKFSQQLQTELKNQHYDAIIGFNKLAGLDFYFAADNSYLGRLQKNWWPYRLWPRYKTYSSLENVVFNQTASTKILCLTSASQTEYQQIYNTPDSRFHQLPPGVDKKRLLCGNPAEIRKQIRTTFNIPTNDFLLLSVGSSYTTKGVDRSLQAIAALPKYIGAHTHFFVIGRDKKTTKFKSLATRLGIENNVHFLGPRDDVAGFYYAADLLLHPAYHETAGVVLLEALVAGLPVLATANCGYASYVKQANSGVLLTEPFDQKTMNVTLLNLLEPSLLKNYQQRALNFAEQTNFGGLHEKVVELIGAFVSKR